MCSAPSHISANSVGKTVGNSVGNFARPFALTKRTSFSSPSSYVLMCCTLAWLAPRAVLAAPGGAPQSPSTEGVEESSPAAATVTPASGSQPSTPTAEDKKKAAEHFETGIRLYEDGEYSLALIEFERAYSYVTDYRVLFNIGQVSVQLGRYSRAVKALEQYLAQGSTQISRERLAAVQEDLKMLQGRTARLTIDCDVVGAEVLLDDVRLGYTPLEPLRLVDAGEHRLVIQKPGYATRSERVVLAGRDDFKQRCDITPLPAAATEPQAAPKANPVRPPPPPGAAANDETTSNRTTWLYAGAGATGLLVTAWAVTGYLGIQAVSDLRDALQRPTTAAELDSYRTRAKGALLASDILGAAALATGGTTLYFTLTTPARPRAREQPKSASKPLGLQVGPSSVWLSGAF